MRYGINSFLHRPRFSGCNKCCSTHEASKIVGVVHADETHCLYEMLEEQQKMQYVIL